MKPNLDIVLLGATGYTGRLCAEYMARTLPDDVTWAVAGRSRDKLEAMRKELSLRGENCLSYALDLTSEDAIAELVKSTRVVVNVVGPYSSTCGPAVVKACAENGTHYVDCNGEMPWVQDMITQHDEVAQASGAVIIVTAGWGAVPADISTYLAAHHIRAVFSLPTREVLVCLDRVRGSFSGGSINSLCAIVAQYSPARLAAATAPFALSPVLPPAGVAPGGVLPGPNRFGVSSIRGLGAMVPSTQSAIETAVVGRSWGLHAGVAHPGQRPDGYGPDFHFSSLMRFPNGLLAWAFLAGFLLLNRILASSAALRTLVGEYLFPAGTGQTAEQRRGNHFSYRTIGVADVPEGAEARRVEVDFAYDGDAYFFTGVSLTQAALLLLEGGTPAHARGGGILTPALLGDKFVERLKSPEVGVKIEIKTVSS